MNKILINMLSIIVFALFLMGFAVVWIVCIPLFVLQAIVSVVGECVGRMK